MEARFQEIMLGMNLALKWSIVPILVLSDSMVALCSILNITLLKSEFGNLVKEIKNFIAVREIKPLKILRDQNRVFKKKMKIGSTHCLANYARTVRSTAYWMQCRPGYISELILTECNAGNIQ